MSPVVTQEMDLHFLSPYAQGEWTRDPIDAWYASGG